LSIVEEHDSNLNEYKNIIKKWDHFGIENIDGNLYSIFPIGVSVLSTPFVAIAKLLYPPLGESASRTEIIRIYKLELIIASIFCAITASMIYFISRSKLRVSSSLLIVFIFSFCTSSWSTSSRALWQHGPSMLMLSIALYLIIREKRKKGLVKYSAIPLAIAFIVRPTNAISIFFFSIYILINHKQQVLSYLMLALPFAISFFIYNISVYNSILPSYFKPQRVLNTSSFFEGLAGNMISPARGLLIFSPMVLFGIIWIILNFLSFSLKTLPLYLITILISHWIVISSFPQWWAGHSYGPRFFADVMPFFMYFIILFFVDFQNIQQVNKRIIFLVILLLMIVSFYINAKGAFSWSVHKWNVEPNNVDYHHERLWDWSDLQFLR
jgi:hypothetical protein